MTSGTTMRGAMAALALVLWAGPQTAQAQDAVEAMCTDLDRPAEVCNCAAERLREDVGEADYGLYQEVGAVYREGRADGQDMAEAWDAAVAAVAAERGTATMEVLPLTNRIGREHREAMDACEG